MYIHRKHSIERKETEQGINIQTEQAGEMKANLKTERHLTFPWAMIEWQSSLIDYQIENYSGLKRFSSE